MQTSTNLRCFRGVLGLLVASNGLPAFAAFGPDNVGELIDISGGREPIEVPSSTWIPFDPDSPDAWRVLFTGTARAGLHLRLNDGDAYHVDAFTVTRRHTALCHALMQILHEEATASLQQVIDSPPDADNPLRDAVRELLIEAGKGAIEGVEKALTKEIVPFIEESTVNVNEPCSNCGSPDCGEAVYLGDVKDVDLTDIAGFNADELSRKAGAPEMPELGTAPVLALRNSDGSLCDFFEITGAKSRYYTAVYENGSIVMEFVEGPLGDIGFRSDMYTDGGPDITSMSPLAAFNSFMGAAGKRVHSKEWEMFDVATGESLADRRAFPQMEFDLDDGTMHVELIVDSYPQQREAEPALAMDSAVLTEPQPAAGTTVVVALRLASGEPFESADEHGPYHLEITSDGNIWTHHEDGVIQSFVKPEDFPTTTKDIGRELGRFLSLAGMMVGVGVWEGFNHETGESLSVEDMPAIGFDGENVIVGKPEDVVAAVKAAADADGKEALNIGTGETL